MLEIIKEIKIQDPDYPEVLKEIPRAPEIIYVKGNLIPNEIGFAIVGTRNCSAYGKQVALEIAGDLSRSGIAIVSGLAPGIDTFSHKAALESKGRTIAVLGTGLDESSIYPKENIGLSRQIVELGGCLVSEYPIGTKGAHFTFPQRNRIIAGLSIGVLVVEAKQKSGALITANYALSQKRKVFAVPGSVYSPNSKGTNNLIKNGATLVDNAADILQELGLKENYRLFPKETERLLPEEKLILEVLREGALHVDKIIEKTKLSAGRIAGILSVAEIKGRIRNLGGNVYSLSHL